MHMQDVFPAFLLSLPPSVCVCVCIGWTSTFLILPKMTLLFLIKVFMKLKKTKTCN